jgi:RNA polymerase sigma-70 factor (ECF subfamily)
MSHFREVDLGSFFQPFTTCREQFGFVPKLFRAQTLVPRAIEAEAELIFSILFTGEALARAQKECILLALAAANGNDYCFSLHYQTLRLLGLPEQRLDRIVADYRQADLAPPTMALLKLALKLGANQNWISREDISEASSQNLTDESILEAILTVALSCLLCRLATGVGAVPDFAPPAVLLPVQNPSASSDPYPALGETSRFYLRAPVLDVGDFAPFAFLQDQFGSVPEVFRAQTLKPVVLEAEARAIRSVLVPEGALTRVQKERILRGRERSQTDLARSDRALLNFSEKLASAAPEFSRSHIQALQEYGFTDEQILETVVVASIACFFRVLQVGLGASPDFAAPWAPPTDELQRDAKKANLASSDSRHTGVAASADPDSERVARVQAGDLDSFEELMNLYSRRVFRTLVGILGNPDEARDAMQDTFLKAFQHLPGFEGRSKFSTWLVTIAMNTGLQRLRERRPTESLDEGFDEEGFRPRQIQAWIDDPERICSRAEMRLLIENAVMGLPSKYRVVLTLMDLEQIPVEEASSILRLGRPAVKSRLLRGRLMLREVLAPHFISGSKGSAKGGTI